MNWCRPTGRPPAAAAAAAAVPERRKKKPVTMTTFPSEATIEPVFQAICTRTTGRKLHNDHTEDRKKKSLLLQNTNCKIRIGCVASVG
jgi:hypothetical protein